MKVSEIIQVVEDNEDFYSRRNSGLRDLYWNIRDAIEEGCVENVDVNIYDSGKSLTVYCEDGYVHFTASGNGLEVKERLYRPKVRPVKARPYERTRAFVYATGNRWAIENFNATH